MAVMDEIVLQRVEFSCALFVFCVRVFFLSANLTLGEDFFHQVIGITSRCQACSKVLMFSSNITLEEFVLRSLRASSLTKPFLTPAGWQLL